MSPNKSVSSNSNRAGRCREKIRRYLSASSDDRNPHLDGIRGIAIILVFTSHTALGVFPRYHPLSQLTKHYPSGGGIIGVQLFFVLSGYLITSLLLIEKRKKGKEMAGDNGLA